MDEELNTAYGRNDLSQALSMDLESVILDDLMI